MPSSAAPATSRAVTSRDRVAKFARWTLVCSGGSAIALVAAARPLGMHGGARLGPTEIQIALAGALLLAAGIARQPAIWLANLLARAHDAAQVKVVPLAARDRRRLGGIVLAALVFRVWMVGAYWP